MGRVCFVFKPMPWVLSLDAADIGSNNLYSDYEKCRKAAFGFWVKRLLQQGVPVYLSRAKCDQITKRSTHMAQTTSNR